MNQAKTPNRKLAVKDTSAKVTFTWEDKNGAVSSFQAPCWMKGEHIKLMNNNPFIKSFNVS